MAETYEADSTDGSAGATGQAKQEFGSAKGTSFSSLEHEDAPTGDAKESGPQTYTAEGVDVEKVSTPSTAKKTTSKRSSSKS